MSRVSPHTRENKFLFYLNFNLSEKVRIIIPDRVCRVRNVIRCYTKTRY